jgi:hypothetical protein
MNVELAVIVLNYRTPDMTVQCLASLEGETEPGIRVVVVDNASGDGSADRLERVVVERGWSAWANVVRSDVNGGFAAGNNLGIRSVEASAYLLLNSDTLVRPGALRGLREAMRLRPDAGIIGAGLLTAQETPDQSCFRVIAPASELVRAASTGPVTRLLRRFDPILPQTEQPMEPGWLGFACVLIRRDVLETVGLLDDGYFMYFEDVDYCRRARQAGWKVLYWPQAKVVHLLGGSSQMSSPPRQRSRAPRYYYEARARYFAKFYGRRGLWLANALWHVGRTVSLPRELLGRSSSSRGLEALDIWTHALDPLRSESPMRTGRAALAVADAPSAAAPGSGLSRDCAGNLNPQGVPLFELIAEDFRTHGRSLLEAGFFALAVHRLGNACMGVQSRLLRAPLSLASAMSSRVVSWKWGIDLPCTVRVGRRVRIWHHGGIVLSARAIGDDVHIRHNTTFGALDRSPGGQPTIGNGVDVGAGARVLGAVTVGDDSVVGPNSVVLRDVPARSVVMGVPARQASLRLTGATAAPASPRRPSKGSLP